MLASKQWYQIAIIGGAVALIAGSVMLFNYASTTTQEREGIFGIAWAANIRDLPDMQLIKEEGDHRFYTRTGDSSKVEGITMDQIVYGFYKGRFYNVMAYFSSMPGFTKMKDRLAGRYGAPYQPDDTGRKVFWMADTVHVLLTYDETSSQGRVAYFYQPIESEIEQNEKSKAQKPIPGSS